MGNMKQIYLAKNADFVITSSQYLAEETIKLNKRSNAMFISSSIDSDKFFPINKYSNDKKL